MAALLKMNTGKLFLRKTSLVKGVRWSTKEYYKQRIGDREIVGFGINGLPEYFDSPDFPFPAIRFQRNTPYIQALREKEKCDWRNLTMEEKKCLYRASFCQTLSEAAAHTGEWKSIMGTALIVLSLALWLQLFFQKCVYDPLPYSFAPDSIKAKVKYAIDAEMEHIDGISSHYDYENDKWKPGYSNPYYDPEVDGDLDDDDDDVEDD